MKQQAHSWLALRALKLIDDSGQAPKLAELLFFYLPDVWQGAWIPDSLIVDTQYGHIFKMDSDEATPGMKLKGQDWLQMDKKKLEKALAGTRRCLDYISGCPELAKPYRAHPKYGGHLPNRVIAVSHSISDMLKLSDFPLSFYAQKKRKKGFKAKDASGLDLSAEPIRNLSLSPNFSARQIALMFFVLSHYVCDAHMPLHCDLRDSDRPVKRRLSDKLHCSIEEVWETWFPQENDFAAHVRQTKSLDLAVSSRPAGSLLKLDIDPAYALDTKILKIKNDEWQEMVYTTRISYAVSRKWISQDYPTANEMIAAISPEEFARVSNLIFHDAVASVARIWYNTWMRYLE
jgi:hypothetical protein